MDSLMALFTTLLTVAIALFAYLTWKAYHRIEWLTGAMESHSEMMLRLKALEQEVNVVWWDPSRKDFPPFKGEHNTPAVLEEIRLGVPPEHREKKPPSKSYGFGRFVASLPSCGKKCWVEFWKGFKEVRKD